ncbi:kinase-like protein [Westerdykella ornata]|uniref:cyclin-dependent kinase n=1 Tax=Westerdykella ornata TaxID=318751 RepID=A0A6A6JEE5_WESOR|nr:kinase-like protein [Westerdykella ornata]KAF2274635.1 kinase-like protein [Westerdykella ornata]
MPATTWQLDLAFSSRLEQVTKLASAAETCSRLTTKADARREATIIETEIFNCACSIEDYHRRCADRVELLQRASKRLPVERDGEPKPEHEPESEPTPVAAGIDIGPYKKAVYHREGLFSVVYKASPPPDKKFLAPQGFPEVGNIKLVALKLTNPSTMHPPHDCFREAKILKLAQSARVIPLLETFREASHFVIVFPFMPFEFGQLLKQDRLSRVRIRDCLRDLFTALNFVHAQGIIHRDVKPSNILLKSAEGPAYLTDFGISWSPAAPGSEAAGSLITDVGTTCYRPPELLFGDKTYGWPLDAWAAGCVAAEALVPGHPTLFDSGELGSDLALIHSIFSKMGTPTLDEWPSAARCPDWGKMVFKEYGKQHSSELMPNCSLVERDFVFNLVRYEPGDRMSASKALEHEYFTAPFA